MVVDEGVMSGRPQARDRVTISERARAAFELDAARRRFEKEQTKEAQDDMFVCARWLLRAVSS